MRIFSVEGAVFRSECCDCDRQYGCEGTVDYNPQIKCGKCCVISTHRFIGMATIQVIGEIDANQHLQVSERTIRSLRGPGTPSVVRS